MAKSLRIDAELQIESFAAWLLAMQLATGNPTPALPPSAQPIVSVNPSDYQVVERAIALLPSNLRPNMSQIRVISPKGSIVKGRQTIAYVRPPDTRIFVANFSDTFRRAAQGDRESIIQLAGALAHEIHHLKHGNAEGPAYDIQISLLKSLGASDKHLKLVQRSRDKVLAGF